MSASIETLVMLISIGVLAGASVFILVMSIKTERVHRETARTVRTTIDTLEKAIEDTEQPAVEIERGQR